jgi:hypothetical protein
VNPPAPLLRDYIETWLRDEGHKTKMALADDGNDALFSFRSRGLEYLVNTDEEHPDFLHLRYTSDEVEFHVEQFLAPGQLDTIFWRCVQILRDSNDAFFAELRAAAPASAARAFISEVTRELHLS